MKQQPILSVIPNRGLTCNKKDLPLLNDNIKRLIKQKNEIFRKYFKGKTANHYMDLTEVAEKLFIMNVLVIGSITLKLDQEHTKQ